MLGDAVFMITLWWCKKEEGSGESSWWTAQLVHQCFPAVWSGLVMWYVCRFYKWQMEVRIKLKYDASSCIFIVLDLWMRQEQSAACRLVFSFWWKEFNCAALLDEALSFVTMSKPLRRGLSKSWKPEASHVSPTKWVHSQNRSSFQLRH